MTVYLATEDELSESVGLRLIYEHPILIQTPPMPLRKGGFGYLRSRMQSWRALAMREIVVLITDLDRAVCPMQLQQSWLGPNTDCPPNLIFRIAVREVESWLLADHEAMKALFGQNVRLSPEPDALPDPKQFLLDLARRAPRSIRNDLVAEHGANAKQGLGYNARLVQWVKSEWSPERAETRSPSLRRARAALRAASLSLGN